MRKFSTKKSFNITVFALIVLCLSLCTLLVNTTIAYFEDESTTSNKLNITLIGTLDLEVTTNFDFENLVLAPDRIYKEDYLGQDIGTYIATTESHDIVSAYVRVKFETTRKNVTDEEFIDNSDLLQIYIEEELITTNETYTDDDKDCWFYNVDDGYYYYIGYVSNTKTIQFNSGYKTSNSMTNIERDAEVKIDYTVEAIQRQYDAYVDVWKTAPSIFVEFALVDKEGQWAHQ